jgi:hypothetical protein
MSPRPQGDGPRLFTVAEANALVPRLQVEFGTLARLRAEIEPLVGELGGAEVGLAVLEKGPSAAPGREAVAGKFQALVGEVNAAVERVNGLGCLVKDLEAGLVDFYHLREGDPVFLCWQFGEPAVTHWHDVEEGFAGRKPLEGVEVEPPAFLN